MFEGLGVGMLVGAVGLGFRHGIDWDHLAALADLTGYSNTRRRRVLLGTMYALGHAAVVFALGVAAIAVGASLPSSIDGAMERVVGFTLVLLGVWVLVSLVRQGREFRLRSRWMVASSWIARGVSRLRGDQVVVIEHQHEHEHTSRADALHQARPEVAVDGGRGGDSRARPARSLTMGRSHRHRHVGVIRDPLAEPSLRVALGIGCIHGLGAETPTQLVVLTTAAGVQGGGAGVAFLLMFIFGLILSNTSVATAMAFGRLDPERSFPIYAAFSIAIALFSIVAGLFFLLGAGGSLPSISGS